LGQQNRKVCNTKRRFLLSRPDGERSEQTPNHEASLENMNLKLNNLGHVCYLIIKNIDFKIMPNHRTKFEFQIEADRSRDFYKRRPAIPFVVQSLRQKPSTLNTTLCKRWIFIQVQFLYKYIFMCLLFLYLA